MMMMMMMMEGSKKIVVLQVLELFVIIVFSLAVQGSAGSVRQTPTASPPLTSVAVSPTTEGSTPSLPLHSPTVSSVAPSSMDFLQYAPAILPRIPETLAPISHQRSTSDHYAPHPEPVSTVASPPKDTGQIPEAVRPAPLISPVQGVPPMIEFHKKSTTISPVVPGEPPPVVQGGPSPSEFPENSPAISPVLPGESEPSIPVQGAPPPSQFPQNSPAISPVVPGESPPIAPVQGVLPATGLPQNSPAFSPVVPGETPPDGDVSPASTPPTSTEWKRNITPAAAPNETPEPVPPVNHSPTEGSFSDVPPSMHNATRNSTIALSPSKSLPKSSPTDGNRSPASSPTAPVSNLVSPPSKQQAIPPAVAPTGRPTRYAPPPFILAVPPIGGPSRYAPPSFPPAVAPTSRPSHFVPPPFLPAVPPTGGSSHFAPPPFPPVVPPTGGSRLFAPPPFSLAVPPTSMPTHHAPPPFLPAVPPRGRQGRYSSPPFPPAVPPTGKSSHFVPPPFPPAVPPTSRPTHHAPPPFLPAVPPRGRQGQYAPPPFPPAVPPTGKPFHYAPPPFPPAVPPTGRPTHYAPPPFFPAVPPRGIQGRYAPPPFPPAVPPTGKPSHFAPPPFPPAVPPTGRPTHYAPPPFPPVVPPKGSSVLYAPPPFPPAVPPTGRPIHLASPPFLPAVPPRGRQGRYTPPPLHPVSFNTRTFPPSTSQISPAPSPALKPVSASTTTFLNPHPPQLSPSGSSSKSTEMSPPPPIVALPPPPPNEDCSGTICTEPLTNTPPGSPCVCVWPMQVGLSLGVDLYTFFPLVLELATEVAAGVFMKQSQVRIMGANAASQQPEKTIVLIDLVPMDQKFDNTTAYLTFQRFWSKKVDIKESYFGDYEVLYVRYQGLPPSPPLPPSSTGMINDGQYSGNDYNGQTTKPIGVAVPKKRHRLNGSIIAIIVLSAFVVLCSAATFVLLLKQRRRASPQPPTPQASMPSLAKQSGTGGSMIGNALSSDSLSFESGIATYTGSAKTYSITDLERATNYFDESRILGEGGFGLVYSAVLDDGTKAAVKVLKRDNHQGDREFLAEVEMLSRLHHRNLVKLIGICTEARARCLVYELIPNGSVESHLHGVDKDSAPLDWVARMKIALGAARGLAYLHEDSSPRVIHRDFKSSNILLENDFTPKVSDFGLARTAQDEENRYISTRVMGTFGYVAPEYAMTGHLLVKSDVYSYGVVLLELLTGRKPVDMSQPCGQENLVAWARPLLTSTEGLEILMDSSLGLVPPDSIPKVAAIASMCVQPEVSHRPFMGEVVQALKLVCNECDEARETCSRSASSGHEDLSVGSGSDESPDLLRRYEYSSPTRYSGYDLERGESGSSSFRRHSGSGPLRTGRGWRFLQRANGMPPGGSVSEHRARFGSHSGSY